MLETELKKNTKVVETNNEILAKLLSFLEKNYGHQQAHLAPGAVNHDLPVSSVSPVDVHPGDTVVPTDGGNISSSLLPDGTYRSAEDQQGPVGLPPGLMPGIASREEAEKEATKIQNPGPGEPTGTMNPDFATRIMEISQEVGNPVLGFNLCSKYNAHSLAEATPEQQQSMLAEAEQILSNYSIGG